MATKNSMIKGTTKTGINFNVDEKSMRDMRLLADLTKLQNPDGDWVEKSNAMFSMLRRLFGTEDKMMSFLDEVADAHKGDCSPEIVMVELNDVFEALNAKNS